jgi:hypothetical protein
MYPSSGNNKPSRESPKLPHDPLACSLGPDLADLCQGCGAEPPKVVGVNAYDRGLQQFERLRVELRDVQRGDGLRPWEPLPPLDGEHLRRVVLTFLHPRTRPIVQKLVRDLLAVRPAPRKEGGAA